MTVIGDYEMTNEMTKRLIRCHMSVSPLHRSSYCGNTIKAFPRCMDCWVCDGHYNRPDILLYGQMTRHYSFSSLVFSIVHTGRTGPDYDILAQDTYCGLEAVDV
jgi:hypothetical protein